MTFSCVHDPFPTPFSDEVLYQVVGNETYSFTNGFFGYHHVKIIEEYKNNTTFNKKWGSFSYIVVPFGLENSPSFS